MRRLGLVLATDLEASAVLERNSLGWRRGEDGLWEGGGGRLVLSVSGVGKVYAAWAYALLSPRCDAVVSLGASGGLGREPVGSVWLCGEFVEHDMCVEALGCPPGVTPLGPLADPVMASSSPALDALCRASLDRAGIPFGRCRAMAGDEFVTDPERAGAKRDAFEAALVDMETAAMAKLALSRSGKPFAALRIVSDNADHEAASGWEEGAKAASARFASFAEALAALLDPGA